jgi:plasmid stability protein
MVILPRAEGNVKGRVDGASPTTSFGKILKVQRRVEGLRRLALFLASRVGDGHAIIDRIGSTPMAQLIVRNLDPQTVSALKARAARSRRSMEAEHREILRAALRPARGRTSLKEWLSRMPDVGTDRDFARSRRRPRHVRV